MCDKCKGNWWAITNTIDHWIWRETTGQVVMNVLASINGRDKQPYITTAEQYIDIIKRHYPDIYARVEKLMALQ